MPRDNEQTTVTVNVNLVPYGTVQIKEISVEDRTEGSAVTDLHEMYSFPRQTTKIDPDSFCASGVDVL